MKQTKIEWCDASWNPVTGCLHGCPYCYARGIAKRFGGYHLGLEIDRIIDEGEIVPLRNEPLDCEGDEQGFVALDEPLRRAEIKKGCRIAPYPYDFRPTFHRYRLDWPQKQKEQRTIFVGSMTDLFGEWVPDSWISEVFDACAAAPQHRYLFLTKNPARYTNLAHKWLLPDGDNYWFGSTATTQDMPFWWSDIHNTFVSIEPIHGPFDRVDNPVKKVDWVIIGAESGQRKDKVAPEREWVENIVKNCKATSTPLFMKNSLKPIWGDDIITEFPWQ